MIFKTKEDVTAHIPLGASVQFNTIKPALEFAQIHYLKPLLGEAMHAELQEYYDSEQPTTDEVQQDMKKLVAMAQFTVAHLAFYNNFDQINVYIDENGFKQLGDSGKLKGLYKYQEDNLRSYFRFSGFNSMDDLLIFMEDNKTSFTEYFASDTAKEVKKMIIPSTAIFDGIVKIYNSRLIFNKLINHMRTAEEIKIKAAIGTANYNYIKTELAKDTPAAKVIALLPFLRKPVAYYASAYLMQESGADLTDKGLIFEGRTANNINDAAITAADLNRVTMLVARQMDWGDTYLQMLLDEMAANPTDWNNIQTSSTRYPVKRDNTGKKTFFA